MADFATKSTTKTAVRKLANPLADVTAFETLVQGVITNNPFQCVPTNTAGVNNPPVERSREGYTAKVVYSDASAKSVGIMTIRAQTVAAFTAVANRVIGDAVMATSCGGTPSRDFANETYSASLKCHDANGELYYVNFARDQVTLTSYSDEAIRARVETWADTVSALG